MICSTAAAWIKCFRPVSRPALRLFCVPYAGAGASVFRSWSANLPAAIEVCAIQLPGREDRLREPAFTHLPSLVEALAPALHSYLETPYAVFGHSLGALIGFELVRLLRTQQQPSPVRLLVSGRRAPQIGDRHPQLHRLPEPEFLQELRALNGTPAQVLDHPELMRLFLPTLRADFALCGTYVYRREPPIDCSISAFGGTEDWAEPLDLLSEWRTQTRAQFSLDRLNGNHFFLQTHQPILLKMIAQQLQEFVQRSDESLCQGEK